MGDGVIVIGTKIETKSFDKQIDYLESKLNDLEASVEELDLAPDSMQYKQLQNEIEKTKNSLVGLYKQKQKAENGGTFFNFSNMKDGFKDILSKVTKWGLALFGIRSTLSLISRATGIVSQNNKELGNQIESIKYTLAFALEGVVQKIVNGIQTAIQYTQYLIKAWFGVDIFANAVANSTKKANTNAKAMAKTLSGFDEMNVLNDNGTTGTAGGLEASALKGLTDSDVPEWLKKLGENGELAKKVLAGILGALVAIKALNFLGNLKIVNTIVGKLFGNLHKVVGNLTAIKGLGIAIALLGIAQTIAGIINFIKDPSWNTFADVLLGISVTLAGLGIATGNWKLALGGILGAVGSLTLKLFTNKKETLNLKTAQEKLKKAQDDLKNSTKNYYNAVDNAEEAQKRLKEAEEKASISAEDLMKKMELEKISYEDLNSTQREVLKAYTDNKEAQEELKKSKEDLTQKTKAEEKALLEEKLAVEKAAGNYDEYKKKVIEAYDQGKISAEEARDYIEQAMQGMSNASKKTFTEDLPSDIEDGLDPNKYEGAWKRFRSAFTNFFQDLWDWFTGLFKGNQKVTYEIEVKGEGIKASGFKQDGIKKEGWIGAAKGGIIKCASGAIVSRPGRGVPVSNAIYGERGREAIFPLTDTQQMELLGEEIGKHININANIVNTMNGRVISREIQRIQNNNDFAFNR